MPSSKQKTIIQAQANYQLRKYKFTGRDELLEIEVTDYTDSAAKDIKSKARIRILNEFGKPLTEYSEHLLKLAASKFFGTVVTLLNANNQKLIQALSDITLHSGDDNWKKVQYLILSIVIEGFKEELIRQNNDAMKQIKELEQAIQNRNEFLEDGDLGKA